MGKYQCIECGAEVESLFHDYNTDVIKIHHCDACHSVADKYIEYEPVIIILDALLLQPQAYRHLLINTSFNSHWRLALILWICDAFTKLILERSEITGQQFTTNFEYINYAFLGMELYSNYIIAAVELFVLIGAVLVIYGTRDLFQNKTIKPFSTSLLMKAVICASFGRVLAIPALLWGDVYRHLYMILCQVFVFLSTMQALKAVDPGPHKTFFALLAVSLGFSVQLSASSYLYLWLK
ncbi:protein ARV1-like isoform X1 [Biomphalaria glabrata]|uniref:Protein ARV n=1 Tax=Biomphalaria glabrata TaxID=6526 RepID=A0A9W2ZZL6_BIOGL|nr:protein ARV1-like isoform X1 [Biomphalaria glabrata]KAI8747520.1 protein ARV1-like [Biomphalaria glabrata]